MTPLQALEIVKGLGQRYTENDTEYQEAAILLTSLVTPPTADEVCEELERYFYQCVGKANPYVKYIKDLKQFIYVIGDEYHEIVVLDKHGYINFMTSLPPYLISIIARFYEGRNNADIF